MSSVCEILWLSLWLMLVLLLTSCTAFNLNDPSSVFKKKKKKKSEVCFIFPSVIGREKVITMALIMTELSKDIANTAFNSYTLKFFHVLGEALYSSTCLWHRDIDKTLF